MSAKYLVRVLSNDGRYADTPVILEDWALMAADEEMAWSAVHVPSIEEARGDLYGLTWLAPAEIMFYAAVSLAEPDPRWKGRVRPLSRNYFSILKLRPPIDPERFYRTSREVAQDMERKGEATAIPQQLDSPNIFEADYNEQALDLANTIEPRHLLIRGLDKFLKATELIRYPHLLEEAGLAAFISREAALELLRRKFSDETGKRLKKQDVLDRIEADFPTGKPFVEVLETDWEARIIFTHPTSKFGERWSPQVFREECYDAVHTLTALYRYFLLDEAWTPKN